MTGKKGFLKKAIREFKDNGENDDLLERMEHVRTYVNAKNIFEITS